MLLYKNSFKPRVWSTKDIFIVCKSIVQVFICFLNGCFTYDLATVPACKRKTYRVALRLKAEYSLLERGRRRHCCLVARDVRVKYHGYYEGKHFE